jgi:DNA-binding NarL/FixJ family response regulator
MCRTEKRDASAYARQAADHPKVHHINQKKALPNKCVFDGSIHRRVERILTLKTRKSMMTQANNAVKRTLIVEDDNEFQILLSDSMDQINGNWRTYSYSLGRDACSFIDGSHGNLNLALIDLGLPDMDGTLVISKVRKRFPNTPILVVSVINSSKKLMQALDAGATGYILKDDDAIGISASINSVLQGHTPISPAMTKKLIQAIPQKRENLEVEINLSDREQELLMCISKGLSYSSSAKEMGLQIST